MKQFISKSHLILVFIYVISIAHTLAEPPQEVMDAFIAHRQRQREARLSASAGLKLQAATVTHGEKDDDRRNIIASSNWAGAVQSPAPSGLWETVSAQWVVPSLSPPPSTYGDAGIWFNSQWVGIDGDSCYTAILQAGVSSYVQVINSTTPTTIQQGAIAWYEWFPLAESEISGFNVSVGDTIEVSVHAFNLSQGVAELTNLSEQNSTTIILDAPTNSSELCGFDAEWIVEDASDGGLIPFANFSVVTFTECTAITTTGATVHLSNATFYDIVQSNIVLATPVADTDTEFQVFYGQQW